MFYKVVSGDVRFGRAGEKVSCSGGKIKLKFADGFTYDFAPESVQLTDKQLSIDTLDGVWS